MRAGWTRSLQRMKGTTSCPRAEYAQKPKRKSAANGKRDAQEQHCVRIAAVPHLHFKRATARPENASGAGPRRALASSGFDSFTVKAGKPEEATPFHETRSCIEEPDRNKSYRPANTPGGLSRRCRTPLKGTLATSGSALPFLHRVSGLGMDDPVARACRRQEFAGRSRQVMGEYDTALRSVPLVAAARCRPADRSPPAHPARTGVVPKFRQPGPRRTKHECLRPRTGNDDLNRIDALNTSLADT